MAQHDSLYMSLYAPAPAPPPRRYHGNRVGSVTQEAIEYGDFANFMGDTNAPVPESGPVGIVCLTAPQMWKVRARGRGDRGIRACAHACVRVSVRELACTSGPEGLACLRLLVCCSLSPTPTHLCRCLQAGWANPVPGYDLNIADIAVGKTMTFSLPATSTCVKPAPFLPAKGHVPRVRATSTLFE